MDKSFITVYEISLFYQIRISVLQTRTPQHHGQCATKKKSPKSFLISGAGPYINIKRDRKTAHTRGALQYCIIMTTGATLVVYGRAW